MTPQAVDDFRVLTHELDRCLAETITLASSARTSTATEWRALCDALRVALGRPLPYAGDAANPAEVRAVLQEVCTVYERRLRRVERRAVPASTSPAGEARALADAIWTFRHRRLAQLVETELAAYIRHVAPRPSIATAFGKVTPVVFVAATPAHVQVHRCKHCGAPRRAERLYGDCLYCGHPLFEENA